MNALHPNLRNKLEGAVLNARDIAERGAKNALERLAVGAPEPFSEMSPEERELRNRLRARGRQLGDILDQKTGKQTFDHLIAELAYEYWHRMLFARFLAENHLLMHPDGIPVSLDECQELAEEESASDGWTLAARYASRMLPEIFRTDDPVLLVKFAPEDKRDLERELGNLPSDVFLADDSIGWVYQFWQAKQKEKINKSGTKIGADELPAVTQLFTEHYMVLFLLHNSLGAWWAANHPGEEPPVEFEYLRLLEDSTPAAGSFPGWPKVAKELKILDPCCGSGHFLVAVFDVMVRFRMKEEGLSVREAADAVLRENLFGLEIDQRCTQIAAFALALAAWKFPGAGGYRRLPPLNIACSGIAPRRKKQEWLMLAGDDERLQSGMENLYELFQQAPELGSLIDPHVNNDSPLLTASFAELQPLLEQVLKSERASLDFEFAAAGVAAKGIAHAAELLSRQYHLIITNVPYLLSRKQGNVLSQFCEKHYIEAKANLATVFIERCLSFCLENCSTALVTPQNLLSLTRYKNLRSKLLSNKQWNLIVRLGTNSFETINGEVVNVILLVITNQSPINQIINFIEASSPRTAIEKATLLQSGKIEGIAQNEQLKNPDHRIAVINTKEEKLLSEYAIALSGLSAGDSPRFDYCFWEIPCKGKDWEFLQSTVEETQAYGGRSHIIFWEREKGAIFQLAMSVRHLNHAAQNWLRGKPSWGKKGVVISQMGDLPCTLYLGDRYDQNCCAIIPINEKNLAAIWAFCSSPDFNLVVRQIDQSLKITPHTLLKVPFDLAYWQSVADEMGPLPEPHSNDPTQWLFKGNIVGSTSPLQTAVARLLGYRWPEQSKDELDEFSDDDGIVCIPAVRGEKPAADRLRELLAAAYGKEWSPAKQEELVNGVGFGGKALDNWLHDGFFDQHCKLFHQRPFIWHIWDGRRDGFSVLVNYHKLDRRNLERLAYTYLGDWIKRQEDGLSKDEGGAEARLIAARELQKRLKLILEGEDPYDIFVRWKPIEKQPIGWEPDLNDGVRLNIRPFVIADVLRKRPSINWNKDRGKNPPGSPWGEERINDHNLKLAEKQAARKKAEVAV